MAVSSETKTGIIISGKELRSEEAMIKVISEVLMEGNDKYLLKLQGCLQKYSLHLLIQFLSSTLIPFTNL